MPILQEQDFGCYEGKTFSTKPKDTSKQGKRREQPETSVPGFKLVETKAEMAARMDKFLDHHLLPILQSNEPGPEPVVAIVSHGMILSTLWKCLLKRFALHSVKLAPGVHIRRDIDTSFEHLGAWSNTGYLQLDIQRNVTRSKAAEITELLATEVPEEESLTDDTQPLTIIYNWTVTVQAVNSKTHLQGLKRTGGGVGSSKYDESQKSIDTFFKKRRTT